jgi:hypothetical protein
MIMILILILILILIPTPILMRKQLPQSLSQRLWGARGG